MNIPILYEDENVVVVNKPAGLLVHGEQNATADSKLPAPTLVEWLVSKYPEIKNVGDMPEIRPGIVHRLDKDTSGVLVAAKNQRAFGYLKKQFAAHAEDLEKRGKRDAQATGANQPVKKKYLALVCGAFREKRGTIKLPIGRSASDFRKKTAGQRGSRGDLREAVTEYNVLRTLEDKNGDKFSLLEVFPRTGRTHQIRVHLRAVSHPVVGDSLYGFKKSVFPLELKRQFLHANSLEFNLPSGERVKIEACLPDELEKVLGLLHGNE